MAAVALIPSKTFANYNNTTITYTGEDDQKTVDHFAQEGRWTVQVFRLTARKNNLIHFGGDIWQEYYRAPWPRINKMFTLNRFGDAQARNSLNILDMSGLSVYADLEHFNSNPPFEIIGSIVNGDIDDDFVCVYDAFGAGGMRQEGHLLITNGNVLNKYTNQQWKG